MLSEPEEGTQSTLRLEALLASGRPTSAKTWTASSERRGTELPAEVSSSPSIRLHKNPKPLKHSLHKISQAAVIAQAGIPTSSLPESSSSDIFVPRTSMIDPSTSLNPSSSASFSSTPQQRLQHLSSHITASSTNITTIMAVPSRDPITCHVLDTTTGRPGASIVVSLNPVSSPTTIFHSTTNSDGRVTNWSLASPSSNSSTLAVTQHIQSLIQTLAETKEGGVVPRGSSLWKLQFATGEYYGADKTFFPVVELTFLVKEGEHFHVPLLLGPYSFTTYRGS